MTYKPGEWTWWQDALAGKNPPIHNDTPMTGVYALRRSKSEKPLTVIFWYSSDQLYCEVDGQSVKYGLDVWPNAARHPITSAVYESVRSGNPWPHEIIVETASGADSSLTNQKAKNNVGHNSGDTADDDFTTLTGNLQEWADRAKKLIAAGTPKTQAEADAVADTATKLAARIKEVDDARKAETGPMYERYKTTNARWTVVLEKVETLPANLKALGQAFIKAETKRREDAAAKVNADLAAAAAAEAPPSKPGSPPVEDPSLAPAPAPRVEAVPVTIGTTRKMSASSRKDVKFDDFAAAAAFFCTMKNVSPEIYEPIRKAAYVVLKSGVDVPGAKLIDV